MKLTKTTVNYEAGDKKVALFINPLKEIKGKTLGFVDVNIKDKEDKFVMSYSNISIVQGKDGIFLSEPTRPSYVNKDGDTVYPPYYIMAQAVKQDITNKITEHFASTTATDKAAY